MGSTRGRELARLPAAIVAWNDFRAAFPNGSVLSRETGHTRSYGSNPYSGYDSATQPFLFRDKPDPRLPAMERVLHVVAGGAERIYPFGAFTGEPVINDEVGGEPVVVMSRGGTLSVLDRGTIADSRRIPSAAAYSRRQGERVIEFEVREGRIADTGTGSVWNLFGEAVEGPLAGSRPRAAFTGRPLRVRVARVSPRRGRVRRPAAGVAVRDREEPAGRICRRSDQRSVIRREPVASGLMSDYAFG